MAKEEERRKFVNIIMNAELTSEEKEVFSALVARDLKGSSGTFSSSRKHSPKDTVSFLYQFSKDELLKWFTHDPEGNQINYISNYQAAGQRLQEEAKSKNLNSRTFTNVKNFINETAYLPQDYKGDKIGYSWRNVIHWIKENPNCNPFTDCVFEQKKFKEYVLTFKNTIEFRTDNEALRFPIRLIDFIDNNCNISDEIKGRLNIDDSVFEIGDSLKTYIDVRLFFQGLKQIFEWIEGKRAISRNVHIELKSRDDYYELIIFHQGSMFCVDDQKLKGLDGDFKKTRDLFFSVADWTIEADRHFDGSDSSIRMLCMCGETTQSRNNDNTSILTENIIEEISERVGGVKHILRIYKNTGE